MFNRLIASSRNKPHKAWNPGTVVFSIAAHALIFAAIFAVTRPGEPEPDPPPKPEEVTYVDVTEIPPPPEPEVVEPEPEVEQPKPQAPQPAAAPRQPRKPPPVQKPTEVAGTQELKTPPVVTGIPDPSVAAPPVKAEDFGGRGAIGGTAAGTPPPAPPATATGAGTGGGSSGTSGTYSAAMVDKRAELLNRTQIAKRLQQLYPPLLRDAGVTGKVTVQMVVGTDGKVDMNTVKIISKSHEAFGEITMQIMKDMRFSPAKMGSTSVRMLTVIPVTWTLNQ